MELPYLKPFPFLGSVQEFKICEFSFVKFQANFRGRKVWKKWSLIFMYFRKKSSKFLFQNVCQNVTQQNFSKIRIYFNNNFYWEKQYSRALIDTIQSTSVFSCILFFKNVKKSAKRINQGLSTVSYRKYFCYPTIFSLSFQLNFYTKKIP